MDILLEYLIELMVTNMRVFLVVAFVVFMGLNLIWACFGSKHLGRLKRYTVLAHSDPFNATWEEKRRSAHYAVFMFLIFAPMVELMIIFAMLVTLWR